MVRFAIVAAALGCLIGIGYVLVSSRPGPPEPAVSYEPLRWREGQWRRHRIVERDGRQTVSRVTVKRVDESGFWLEQEHTSYDGEVQITTVHFEAQPSSMERALELVRGVVVRMQDGETMSWHFGSGDDTRKAELAGAIVSIAGLVERPSPPLEDVKVPAGQFRGCMKLAAYVARGASGKPITGWYHPSVPLGGMVQGQSPDGEATMELLEYGVPSSGKRESAMPTDGSLKQAGAQR
jgi:hypothetical protein